MSSADQPTQEVGDLPTHSTSPADATNSPTPGAESSGPAFSVVGIGASAGGLEAFTSFLRALPTDTGMAFVLIQHLAPDHKSMLAEILSRFTSMPVMEVHDEPPVLPNHVYVIPPARRMSIVDSHLKVFPQEGESRPRYAIDSFFQSLAATQSYRAIAVLLSGMGSDGTLGLEAIKAEGGITFAQDESAQQTGMPRSAIASGAIDYVLPPEQIAVELAAISRNPLVSPSAISEVAATTSSINKILRVLHQETGVDFTHYKSTTLFRRITRRMRLKRLNSFAQYETFLRSEPAELHALYGDILISVTSFFRDPAAFQVLQSEVIPKLFENRRSDDPLRIWVLGCSSGEEAYSIAISVSEYCAEKGLDQSIQLFATDLNGHGIERARAGIYPARIAGDVPPELLRKYFTVSERGYVISRSIREMCVFARQNVLSDPPFSRLDLITCRNVLIYLDQTLQRKVLPLFHFALKPGGILWLGTSESLGTLASEFTVLNAKAKIFARHTSSVPLTSTFPITTPGWKQGESEPLSRTTGKSGGPTEITREADRLALARYAPSSVLVNGRFEVIQYRGNTGPYLVAPPGKPTSEVLKLAREGLLVGLRQALQNASQSGQVVREQNLQIQTDNGFRRTDLAVFPVSDANGGERHYLVCFENPQTPSAEIPSTSRGMPEPRTPDDSAQMIERLKREVVATREYMQSLVEHKEASYEELQAANEEIQSSNEELQSVNEELQTSKEELQSSAEELATVNEELRQRNDELDRNVDDLANFVAGTNLAVVMVGNDRRIRRFTPQAERQLKLIASDVGRPIDDLKLPFGLPDFDEALSEVIDTVTVKEFEVQDKAGRWFSLRIRPYKTLEKKIDGALIVLIDIDQQKQTEERLRNSEERYRLLIEGAEGIAIISLDDAGRVTSWNIGAERLLGYRESEIIGESAVRFFTPQDQAEGRLQREMNEAVSGGPADDDNWLVRKDGSRFWAGGAMTALRDKSGRLRGFSKIVRDATERRRQDAALRVSEARFRSILDRATVGIMQISRNGQILLANRHLCELLGYSSDGLQSLSIRDLVHSEDLEQVLTVSQQLFAGEIENETLLKRLIRKDGTAIWVLSSSTIVPEEFEGAPCRISVIQDVTARKIAEEALSEADRRKDQFLALLAHELRNPLAPLRTSFELLRHNIDPATTRRVHEVMERQVNKLVRLVDDLLDAARITQGKIELVKQTVDLRTIIREAVESAAEGLNAEGHALNVRLPEGEVLIYGDPVRLEQIVANLLTNAGRYSDRGRPIELSLLVENQKALLTVKDAGIGISSEMLPRIFDLFVQADSSPARARGGLGIGLSLVRQLVTLHDGRIEARSTGLGQGSEFIVELPLASQAIAAGPKLNAESLQAKLMAVSEPRRILVIDDNVDAAGSLGHLLGAVGHDVQLAYSGPSGLEIAARFKPAIVLLDIGLPGMDGYAVAVELRKHPATANATIAAVSGFGSDEDRRRTKEAGFDAHLLKPVSFDAVQEIISRTQDAG